MALNSDNEELRNEPGSEDQQVQAEPQEQEAQAPDAQATPEPAADSHVVGDLETDGDEAMPADWADSIDSTPQVVKEGEIVKGEVVAVDTNGVQVDIGAKAEGFIPLAEFPSAGDRPEIGSVIEVAVVRYDTENDVIRLSKRRADYERVWNELEAEAKVGGIVQAMVTERVKGGLRVDVGVPGFVPASHVGTRNLRNLERFVGRSLRLKVLEADRRSKKVILSHRDLVEEERAVRRNETMDRLEEGLICEGKVRNITNYGAFVDLGGVDGLLHISEMSWTPIKHPSDVCKVGDTVRVVVLEIADEGDRISLGMRQILPDPWKEAAAKLRPNSVVKARITRVVRTGAFAQLIEAGIEGFIPIRELSDKRISEPSEAIAKDQEVDLKILDIHREARRMTLSLTAAEQEKERAQYREFMDSQATDRPTLGDQFGAVLASMKDDLEAGEGAEEAPVAPDADDAPSAADDAPPAAEADGLDDDM